MVNRQWNAGGCKYCSERVSLIQVKVVGIRISGRVAEGLAQNVINTKEYSYLCLVGVLIKVVSDGIKLALARYVPLSNNVVPDIRVLFDVLQRMIHPLRFLLDCAVEHNCGVHQADTLFSDAL